MRKINQRTLLHCGRFPTAMHMSRCLWWILRNDPYSIALFHSLNLLCCCCWVTAGIWIFYVMQGWSVRSCEIPLVLNSNASFSHSFYHPAHNISTTSSISSTLHHIPYVEHVWSVWSICISHFNYSTLSCLVMMGLLETPAAQPG